MVPDAASAARRRTNVAVPTGEVAPGRDPAAGRSAACVGDGLSEASAGMSGRCDRVAAEGRAMEGCAVPSSKSLLCRYVRRRLPTVTTTAGR